MTPQQIATNWIAEKGYIKPVNPYPKHITGANYSHFERLAKQHTYPCPTLADGEYRGEELFMGRERIEISLKQQPAIDAWETVEKSAADAMAKHINVSSTGHSNMEKKTAAEQLVHEIYCAEKRGEHNLSIRLLQSYAAQETAGMYSKEQVLSIIGDVKADAVILCDDYEDAQLIKQIDATHYLKPQP